MKLQHVLVATDLSPEARLSYVHAAALAERFDAQVTLFHVSERLDISYLPRHDMVQRAESVVAAARRQLDEEGHWFAERGCRVALKTATGRPAEEIIHVVEREGIDLCVLSRHGAGRSKHFLVGSTAKRVLRHVRVPFLLVPPEDHPQPVAGYRHLLTTTDYSDDSRHGLRVAVSLAQRFGAKLTLAHVARLPSGLVTGAEGVAVRLPDDTLEWVREHHNAKLLEVAQSIEGVEILRHLGIDNSPSAGIVAASVAVGADLIVLPSHGKGTFRAILMGSTSERVLMLSRVPVLVLPRPWLAAE